MFTANSNQIFIAFNNVLFFDVVFVVVVSLQGRKKLNGRGKILGSPPHIVSQSPIPTTKQNKTKKEKSDF